MTQDKDSEKKTTMRLALTTFAKASAWIVAPVIAATFLGKWLDQKFGFAPFLFILTVSLAFVISMIGIIRELKQYLKTIETPHNGNNDITGK